ncbi:Bacterial extracellular solute-binding protein, family 5, partial [Candidatus Magnetobacterium bavaricum]
MIFFIFCGSAHAEGPTYGDTLVEATTAEPSVLLPMLAGDSISHEVAGLIFNGLVKYAPDLSLTGDLAKSWDIDGLTITFHLRQGVRWTDGVEFTAEDVMFGYKTIIDDKTPTAYKEEAIIGTIYICPFPGSTT